MFCRYCGNEIENDSLFCDSCGKKLESQSVVDSKNEPSNKSSIAANSNDLSKKSIVKNEIRCPKCGSNRVQPEYNTPVANKRWQCLSCGRVFRILHDAEEELKRFEQISTAPLLVGSILFLVLGIFFDVIDTSSGGRYSYSAHYSSNGYHLSASSCDFMENLPLFFYIAAAATFMLFIIISLAKIPLVENLEKEVHVLGGSKPADSISKTSGVNILKSFVPYSTRIPTTADFDALISRSGLCNYLEKNCPDDHLYPSFYQIIKSKFDKMIESAEYSNTNNFACRKGMASIDVKLSYGSGALTCEICCRCRQ